MFVRKQLVYGVCRERGGDAVTFTHIPSWRTLHHVVSPGTEEESRSLLRLRGPGVAVEEPCTAARAAATSRPPKPPTSGTWLGCTTWLSPWFDIRRGKHTPVCSGAQERSVSRSETFRDFQQLGVRLLYDAPADYIHAHYTKHKNRTMTSTVL